MTQQRNFWMRWRVRTGYPVGAIFLVLAAPTPRSILIGGMVALIGIWIRAAASGHLKKYEVLATDGPYGRTRNPLYFGSSLMALGFSIVGYSWFAGALVMIYFAVFYTAVMKNEGEDLRRRYGAAFEEYERAVPLFFPRISGGNPRAGQPEKRFSWEQYKRNREYQALIGVLLGLAGMWLRMLLRAKFGY